MPGIVVGVSTGALLIALGLQVQTQPAFEVVSIRRNLTGLQRGGSLAAPQPGGRFIAIGATLKRGVALFFDYGFPRHEYYHPQRAMGTLMGHSRHRTRADPFERPGEQDITAHVDFSALADAAREAGIEVLGYANQAQFLVNCGITEVLAEANVDNALQYAPIAAEAHVLLSPAEMGELFKVLAVGRDINAPLLGFSRGDRRHTL